MSPDLANLEIAIARTVPGWRTQVRVDEIRRLTLESIAQARQAIYLENQYFTSPLVTDALAKRLAEPDGPEVVLITTGQAPSWFDRLTMDRVRGAMLARLRAADRFGRLRAFSPRTSGGREIIVHSKCSIFDDLVLRVGSANLNNRSLGFDSECELGLEAHSIAARAGVERLRDRLVGHFLGVAPEIVARARERHGGLGPAIDSLNGARRLASIPAQRPNLADRIMTAYHIGDPMEVSDAWRPGRRRSLAIARADAQTS